MYPFWLLSDIFTKYQPCAKYGGYSLLDNLDSHLQGSESTKDMGRIKQSFVILQGFPPMIGFSFFVNACPYLCSWQHINTCNHFSYLLAYLPNTHHGLPWKYSTIDNIDSHLQGAKNLIQTITCIQTAMLLAEWESLKTHDH